MGSAAFPGDSYWVTVIATFVWSLGGNPSSPGVVNPVGWVTETLAVPTAEGVKLTVVEDAPPGMLTELDDKLPAAPLSLLSDTDNATLPASGC